MNLLSCPAIMEILDIKRDLFISLIPELQKHGLFKLGGRWKMQQSDLITYINKKKNENTNRRIYH